MNGQPDDDGAALAQILDRAPWLDFGAARVPPDQLSLVPVGPTLVVGMGGSALGSRAVLAVAAPRAPVRVLDSLDLSLVRDAVEWVEANRAAVMVISKSGHTAELLALAKVLVPVAGATVTFVRDPGASPLREIVHKHAAEDVVELDLPQAVGGRFSVFTAVGQAPLHAAGLSASDWVDCGVRRAAAIRLRPEFVLDSLRFRLSHPADLSLIWCYSEALLPLAAWLQQLTCESLGRERQGDRVGEFVAMLRGPADQHSVAQLLLDGPRRQRVTFLDFGPDTSGDDGSFLSELDGLRVRARDATRSALAAPTRLVQIAHHAAGAADFMVDQMCEIVLTANTWGIDPYGQPGVERIKSGLRGRPD